MSAESAPTDASPREALLSALEVRHHVRQALLVGAVLGLAVPLFFLVLVAGGRTDEPLWIYPSLAFVVFATTAMLAAAVLVGRRVLRLAVHPAAIVRRAATAGLLAGALWLGAAAGLALGPGRPWATVVDVTLPWAALLTPVGLWAVYTRYKRTSRAPLASAVATLVALAGALVLADLAAFELVALLPDVGGPASTRIVRLFGVGALALVAGQVAVATLAVARVGARRVLLLVAVPPLVGLAGYVALSPGRLALGLLAAGLGIAWLWVGWLLRGVDDAEVPTGPDPWPAAA